METKEEKAVEPEVKTEGKEQETNKPEKKYDDTDLNNLLVKDRAEYLKKEFGIDDPKKAKEYIKQMKDQEEANKTELQKKEDELQDIKAKLAKQEGDNFILNAKIKAQGLGIKEEFVDDVITLAKNKTTDEVDFDTALTEVIAKYENFKGDTAVKIGTEPQDKTESPKKQNTWW